MLQPDFTVPSRIFVPSCDCLTLQSCCGCVLAWILTNHKRITRASLKGENSHWITKHQFKAPFPKLHVPFFVATNTLGRGWSVSRLPVWGRNKGINDYDDEYVILPIRGVLYKHMHTRARTHTYVYTSSCTHTHTYTPTHAHRLFQSQHDSLILWCRKW